MKKYVLITPARNEADFIEKTIASVVAQTVLPLRWIIVSDGSTDGTDEIVQRHNRQHEWIQLIRAEAPGGRNFGSKARAVQFAYSQLAPLDFTYVGNLDADVSFGPDYFENMCQKLAANPRLGIVGGIRFDLCNGEFRKTLCARNSVGGPFQFFRRECFEAIGGYQPLPFGGIDAVAEITARMKGWEVRSFPEFHVYHHRRTGTATVNSLRSNFNFGIKHYHIGYDPLFYLAQCVFRGLKRKSLLRPLLRFSGYCWAFLRGDRPAVPPEVITYLHREQRTRLKSLLTTGKDPALQPE